MENSGSATVKRVNACSHGASGLSPKQAVKMKTNETTGTSAQGHSLDILLGEHSVHLEI